jgi:NADPH2:quinone reductase
LAAVMVIAVAVPALGSGGSLFGLASHAYHKADRALHRATRALMRASRGLRRGHNASLAAGAVSQQLGSTRSPRASKRRVGRYDKLPIALKAVQIKEFGGPEVLEHTELPDPEPGDREVLVQVARCGINFGDTHVTRNDYLAEQQLPLVPGGEVSGTTPDGRRVAALLMNGGYAEQVSVPEAALIPVPDEVDDDQAAALLLQGLTAWSLLNISARVEPGESVVVEAAGGGTGSLAVQLAKRAGAGRVIALASSDEKRALALELGADAAVDSRADDLRDQIVAANDGEMVDVFLEMSGGEAFEAALRTLAPFGRLVVFGIASRDENEVRTGHLLRNSRAVIGFWLVHLFSRPDVLRRGVEEILGAAASGELNAVIGGVYPLSEVQRAHEDIAGRRSQGKLLLDPSR